MGFSKNYFINAIKKIELDGFCFEKKRCYLFIINTWYRGKERKKKKGRGENFPLKSLQEKSTEHCYEREIHQKESTIVYAY